jgi:integrase
MVRHFKKRADNRLVDTALPKKAGKYADGKGLWLYVTARGSRSWVFRYKPNLREPDKAEGFMGLGSYPAVTVAIAREKAQQAREDIGRGEDPVTANERRAAEQVKATEGQAIVRRTFKEYAKLRMDAKDAEWKNEKHKDQWAQSLETYAYPLIGSLPIRDLKIQHVLDVLNQPMEGGKSFWLERPVTASRVRGRIESVYNLARSAALKAGVSLGDNPADWAVLKEDLPQASLVRDVEHYPAIPYRDLPAFMVKLGMQQGVAALAFQFLILTVARTDEVFDARWSDFDLEAKVWTIPKARSKNRSRANKKEVRKPLSEAALAILETVKDLDKEFVFSARKGEALSENAIRRVRDRIKWPKVPTPTGPQHLTPHGMRSTFKDWATEETEHAESAAELALSHTVGDSVEQAYRRGDMLKKRFQLAEDWARYCMTPPAEQDGKVVPFGKREQRAAGA